MDGFRVKSNGIPADHMLMCKYANPNDIGYQRTSGHLFDMLRDARKELTQTDRLITERKSLRLSLAAPEATQSFS